MDLGPISTEMDTWSTLDPAKKRLKIPGTEKGLLFPVSQAPPTPFEGTIKKESQPKIAEDQLKYPDVDNHKVHLITLQVSKETKPKAAEENQANQRLRQIIRKSHLANRAHDRKYGMKPIGLVCCHDETEDAEEAEDC